MGNAFLAGQGGGGMSNSKIKEYLNSTVGTDNEIPLDKLIPYYIALQNNDTIKEYEVAGTYLINVPIWASKIKVTACAGGGGGGGYDSSYSMGGGGGGGAAIVDTEYPIMSLTSLEITVGKGGSGGGSGSVSAATGTSGGATVIQGIFTLAGGKGGTVVQGRNNSASGAAGGAGGGAGGNHGEAGAAGITGAGGSGKLSELYGGGGGGSLGAGGNALSVESGDYGVTDTAVPTAGVRGGGGGGGGKVSSTYNGANGGDGYVKLEFLP